MFHRVALSCQTFKKRIHDLSIHPTWISVGTSRQMPERSSVEMAADISHLTFHLFTFPPEVHYLNVSICQTIKNKIGLFL